jgi:hypothetical protein
VKDGELEAARSDIARLTEYMSASVETEDPAFEASALRAKDKEA